MRANQANHLLLLRIHISRIPRCRFGLTRHVPAFLCTSRLSRLARRPTAQCHTCVPHAMPRPTPSSPPALLPAAACANLPAGPHARNRRTLKHVITTSRPCTRIVTSHPSLHRAIAAQPTGLPAKGRFQHPRCRQGSCCFRHAPPSSCYLINRPISTIGPAIPNASAPSVPPPAPINKHPRLPSLSLLQRSTARPFACALARRQDNVTVPDQGSAASQGTTYLP
jgi:hypothetical protein